MRPGLLAGAALIGAATSACTSQAVPELTGLHENDQWSWHDYMGAPMLDIHCPAGIGGVTLHSTQGWPGSVVFRLRSKGLENFSVILSGVRYQLEAGSTGTTLYDPGIGNLLELLPQSSSTEHPAFLVRMDLSTVPPAVDNISVSWVDFYR